MKTIVAPDATDLAQYGLDKPTRRDHARRRQHAGSRCLSARRRRRRGLREGLVAPDGVHGRILARGRPEEAGRRFPRQGHVRRRGVRHHAHRDCARGSDAGVRRRSADKWKQVTPTAKTADCTKVDALLTALTNTRATSFVDDAPNTGLDKPELTVTIKYEDGQKQERVAFARHGSDAYARREGDRGAAQDRRRLAGRHRQGP